MKLCLLQEELLLHAPDYLLALGCAEDSKESLEGLLCNQIFGAYVAVF